MTHWLIIACIYIWGPSRTILRAMIGCRSRPGWIAWPPMQMKGQLSCKLRPQKTLRLHALHMSRALNASGRNDWISCIQWLPSWNVVSAHACRIRARTASIDLIRDDLLLFFLKLRFHRTLFLFDMARMYVLFLIFTSVSQVAYEREWMMVVQQIQSGSILRMGHFPCCTKLLFTACVNWETIMPACVEHSLYYIP